MFITIALCLIIARINLRIFHLKAGFVLSDAFIAAAFAAGVSLNAVDITLYRRGVYEPDIDFKMTNWVATEAESVYVYRVCDVACLTSSCLPLSTLLIPSGGAT